MLGYIFNLFYNLQNRTLNYVEDMIIDVYKSILIIPEEEIEMNRLDENNIIMTQPTNQVN